jgi:hypothetical protein
MARRDKTRELVFSIRMYKYVPVAQIAGIVYGHAESINCNKEGVELVMAEVKVVSTRY